jgi:hypothetical protein
MSSPDASLPVRVCRRPPVALSYRAAGATVIAINSPLLCAAALLGGSRGGGIRVLGWTMLLVQLPGFAQPCGFTGGHPYQLDVIRSQLLHQQQAEHRGQGHREPLEDPYAVVPALRVQIHGAGHGPDARGGMAELVQAVRLQARDRGQPSWFQTTGTNQFAFPEQRHFTQLLQDWDVRAHGLQHTVHSRFLARLAVLLHADAAARQLAIRLWRALWKI